MQGKDAFWCERFILPAQDELHGAVVIGNHAFVVVNGAAVAAEQLSGFCPGNHSSFQQAGHDGFLHERGHEVAVAICLIQCTLVAGVDTATTFHINLVQ